MKIAFFEVEKWEEEYLRKNIKGHELTFFEDELSLDNVKAVANFDYVSVFIYSKLDKKLISRLENLKAVFTRSTGFDHIDLKECKKRKIKVFNVCHYGENTVAEHTFALILALSRKIHLSYERTIRGNFSLEGLRGFDLKGKTLGIVGFGRIGEHVARIAKGFEMNVLVYDVKKNVSKQKRLGFNYVSFPNLLSNSDIVSLHCPYNKKTHHLINSKNISKFKKGAYLINTSRGGVVDTTSLVKALSKGVLGGAALDVLEEESMIKEEAQLLSQKFSKENLQNLIENHILLTFDNVLITPHNAFNSKEALIRILDSTICNLKNVNKKVNENLVLK